MSDTPRNLTLDVLGEDPDPGDWLEDDDGRCWEILGVHYRGERPSIEARRWLLVVVRRPGPPPEGAVVIPRSASRAHQLGLMG